MILVLTILLFSINQIYSYENKLTNIHYVNSNGKIGTLNNGEIRNVEDYVVWGSYENRINATGYVTLVNYVISHKP